MTMSAGGLNKLMEECGELVQIAAKKAAFPSAITHADGENINDRLENEMADVFAAAHFVCSKFNLDKQRINARVDCKLAQYNRWDADPNA